MLILHKNNLKQLISISFWIEVLKISNIRGNYGMIVRLKKHSTSTMIMEIGLMDQKWWKQDLVMLLVSLLIKPNHK